MKVFKEGDIVYWGTVKGVVTRLKSNYSNSLLSVSFEDECRCTFTIDGRLLSDPPIVLSHFPYEMEMKEVEPVIAKDTKVWFRDDTNQTWKFGYYSHFENGDHFCFSQSKKSDQTNETLGWNIVVTEDPLS